jgi:hypothetical protein
MFTTASIFYPTWTLVALFRKDRLTDVVWFFCDRTGKCIPQQQMVERFF